MESTTRPTMLDSDHSRDHAPACKRRVDREIGEFRQQKRRRRGDDERERRDHGRRSRSPIRIAATENQKPSRRCTRSRSTSAMPIISTPDGAMSSGATGIRHGPFGVQTVPTCPIIQLASRNGEAEQKQENPALDPALSIVFRHRLTSVRTRPLLPSRSTQLASRAFAAAIAPIMAPRTVAQIAAMGFLDHQIEQVFSAELDRHGKGAGLVDPHQRRMQQQSGGPCRG